ncbi:MAG: enoyl-CoA hydratase/isomerase family protein [Desulfobacula sp.]|jgi:enoyl-CoA hydratase/carnithine racemase
MTEYQSILCEKKGINNEILWVTLNDPDKMNALSDTMQKEFLHLLETVAFDNTIRCLVIKGAGDKSFCSGGDINLFQGLDIVSAYDFSYERGNRIQHLMNYMEKPIIAAVNGYCFAGGMELALCCDFIYASVSAKFGLLEINLGLLPGWGGTVRLPRKIPVNRAKEMIYRGEIINAEEALRWGLINRILPSKEALYSEVEKITAEITSKPALSLRSAKNVINNSITCDSMEAALAIERGAVMWLFSSRDSKEGVASFVEKRSPDFRGR